MYLPQALPVPYFDYHLPMYFLTPLFVPLYVFPCTSLHYMLTSPIVYVNLTYCICQLIFLMSPATVLSLITSFCTYLVAPSYLGSYTYYGLFHFIRCTPGAVTHQITIVVS